MNKPIHCTGAALNNYRLAKIPTAILALHGLVLWHAALVMPAAHAEGVVFNPAFLPEDSRHLDLSAYQNGNPVLPGSYRADVVLNGHLSMRRDVRIEANKDGSNPVVCISSELLERLGVDMARLPPAATEALARRGCASMGTLIESATATFSPATQVLDISIPQAALRRNARGYVSPELWDRGVTAGMLGYNLNANHNKTRGGGFQSLYLGLNGGLNIGDWRLRHDGSMSRQEGTGTRYQSLNTYVQRDITALKSQLTLGQSNTSGEIFDTVSFSGVQLSSDDRMLPESMRGYAPVIRGIARTNARVTIRQAGNVLLESTVAAGPFVINDLYATGYGGDIAVTVAEADGTQQRFVVPYASMSQLLRPGTARFSLTAGQTRNNFAAQQAILLQGTVQYGLGNNLTVYGGAQLSRGYRSILGGLAFGMPIGAVALDVANAQADLPAGTSSGQSVRLSYSKNIQSTGSNFTLAAYRYSTGGYLDFSNAVQQMNAQQNNSVIGRYGRSHNQGRPRSRLSLTADQSLGDWGQFAISGYSQDYWDRPDTDLQFQASYSKQFGQVSFGLSANRSRESHGFGHIHGRGRMVNRLLFTMSMPLGVPGQGPQLTAQVGRDADGRLNHQASLSGSAGQDREYGYGAMFGRDATGRVSTALNGQFTGAKSVLTGSLGQGHGYRSASLGMSGAVVAHPGGVTLTSARGDTMAVVHAAGAEGAKVVGYPGLKLDASGHAVVPYLRPYELNEVAIDPVGTSMNVELEETSQQVAPRTGAVVYLKYGTRTGRAILINARMENGSPLPFGSNVVANEGSSVGVAGQGGQLYVRVKDETRRLLVSWGAKPHQQCVLLLPAPAANADKESAQLLRLDAVCVPGERLAKAFPDATSQQ